MSKAAFDKLVRPAMWQSGAPKKDKDEDKDKPPPKRDASPVRSKYGHAFS